MRTGFNARKRATNRYVGGAFRCAFFRAKPLDRGQSDGGELVCG